MRLIIKTFILICIISVTDSWSQTNQRKLLFDDGWKFKLDDRVDYSKAGFDDSDWRQLDLPHDWSIEKRPDSLSIAKGDGGFYDGGTAWYRKTFEVSSEWENKKVLIYFEGVYMNSEVYINGTKLGLQPYGYTSFDYDLTPFLKNGSNTIAVRVDNSKQPNSRWYTGSGIYRHVWLEITEKVHIAHWGVDVKTLKVQNDTAYLSITTKIENSTNNLQSVIAESTFSIHKEFTNDAGLRRKITTGSVADIEPNTEQEVVQKVKIPNPVLWSPEAPDLYLLKIALSYNRSNELLDSLEIPFGIRTIDYSAEIGFRLNGKPFLFNGGNVHHDNGSLGAKAYDRAEVRRVELLKEAGFNSVRTSHNIPSEAFLYACDSLGLLVIDEAFDGWKEMKSTYSPMEYDYSTLFDEWWKRDVQAMVKRDRNHSSIVMWSIGNEIIERKDPEAVETAHNLANAVKEIDSTRPVTSAMTTWDADWEIFDPLMAEHDIAGYNYQMHRAEDDHNRVPSRVILQTESYPKDAFYNWKMVQEHEYVIGDFVWTAIDYLGESGIGRWYYPGDPEGEHWQGNLFPWHGAYCGDIDLLGWRKPISHYRSMLWNGDEKLYMAVREPNPNNGKIKLTSWAVWPTWESWTWPGYEGKDVDVEVYSRYPKVRLYLNDSVIGEKATGLEEEFKAVFKVPYESGELKAVGLEDDREVESESLKTAGNPELIKLKADRDTIKADNQDLSFISISILDAKGVPQPNADNLLHFEIEGPGEIIAVDNANLKDSSLYIGQKRKAWKGKAQVVIKSTHQTGEIKLTVKSESLKTSKISILSINSSN